ncbi:MAG: HDOD domain-containing protein [Deltaproteobacteria bacterium]|nr:HDOD domain-containing protein [Deltaproteobacteria bacterium]
MSLLNKKNRDGRLAFFKGLDKKQIKTLYDMSAIKKLQPGDTLFKEGDMDQTLNIILSGKIQVEKNNKGKVEQIETLGEGNYVGGIPSIGKTPRTTSAVVCEPSTVMSIDSVTMDALEDNIQLFFQKLLNDQANERIRQLEEKGSKLTLKNTLLLEDIYDVRVQGKIDFNNAEIIQNIIRKIPRLPAFTSSLASMLLDARASVDEITEQIRNDPSLVGIVMKTVNSAYYGFKQKVADVHRAIVLLGFNEIYQMIIAEGIRQTMPKTPEFEKIHSHSVAISRIAAILSKESRTGKPAEMATIGLLHNTGQLVIQLLKEQNPKLSLFFALLDQSQMGSLLLKSWNLPEIVWRSVEFQSYPEFSPPENIDPEILNGVTLLYLSRLCLEFIQKHEKYGLSAVFLDDYTQLINFKDFSVAEICQGCILPELKRNSDTLPSSLKELTENY